ncbi:FxLYD domain-containing protein [Natrinema sp. H-ect4]|uniref:FxLYD domain-containing protein n=1 Tax=Natrinema sp. H-ect4 TaxID=3242699 RepID=UPI0035A9516B
MTTALAGCSESEPSNRETGGTNTSDDQNGNGGGNSSGDTSGSGENPVKLLNHEWYNEGQFSSGVRGQVENVSGETLSYVEVAVYFLDSEGVQFSEGLDNTNELAAGRVWEFDAMFMGEDPSRVDNYEIETSVNNY